MALEDSDIAAITILLSPERLAALTALTGSARTAIELHQETLSLGAKLMNVIAAIEIGLRNSVCENLTVYFGTPGWLTRSSIQHVSSEARRHASPANNGIGWQSDRRDNALFLEEVIKR